MPSVSQLSLSGVRSPARRALSSARGPVSRIRRSTVSAIGHSAVPFGRPASSNIGCGGAAAPKGAAVTRSADRAGRPPGVGRRVVASAACRSWDTSGWSASTSRASESESAANASLHAGGPAGTVRRVRPSGGAARPATRPPDSRSRTGTGDHSAAGVLSGSSGSARGRGAGKATTSSVVVSAAWSAETDSTRKAVACSPCCQSRWSPTVRPVAVPLTRSPPPSPSMVVTGRPLRMCSRLHDGRASSADSDSNVCTSSSGPGTDWHSSAAGSSTSVSSGSSWSV